MIEGDRREPQWQRIRRALAGEIRAGTHTAGERLPAETALAARFGVNRHTLRRAVAALQEDGLVRVEQGRGTFVQAERIDYPVGERTRFSEIIIGADREPASRLVQVHEAPARHEAAEALMVADGTPLVVLETLHSADGQPLSLTAHHFPAERFPDIAERFREHRSITRALYNCGVKDYFRASNRVRTRLPEAREARYLEQPRTLPVLEVLTVNVDPQGRPVEFAWGRYAGHRLELVFRPTGAPRAT